MDGCVFYSYDNGQTWDLKQCPTLLSLFDIYMTDFAGGTGKGWTVASAGYIFNTTDGGNHWFEDDHMNLKYCTRIESYAANDTITWVAAGDGVVLRKVGFADHWEQTWTYLPTDFWGISFVDSLRGWTAGGRLVSEDPGGRGYILRTSGGGAAGTWDVQLIDTMQIVGQDTLTRGHDFMDVKFVDSLTGWVVGGDDITNSPYILKTEDGGTTWDTIDVAGDGILRGVDFINEDEGWTVGEFGVILHTTNSGETWELQASGTRAHLFDVDFIDDARGIVPGDSCLILYTSDGGENWLPANVRFRFIRGDLNADSTLTMADAISCLKYLYVPGTPSPECMKAADLDDNAEISMSDAINLLKVIYVPGTPDPPPPFPECGWDPTPDRLCCDEHPCM
jgi:photosystem II stability/assembly factor-like uncharacterized protein